MAHDIKQICWGASKIQELREIYPRSGQGAAFGRYPILRRRLWGLIQRSRRWVIFQGVDDTLVVPGNFYRRGVAVRLLQPTGIDSLFRCERCIPGPIQKCFERCITYDNLVSNQFAGLNASVMPGTLQDSLSFLAVVFEQQTELQPTEI